MDLHPSSGFDGRPFDFELIHHFFPNEQALIGELFDSVFGLLLEKIESEPPLDFGGFLHQKEQVSVGLPSFEHPEVLLNHCCSEYGAFWTFEHQSWDLDKLAHLILVNNAFEHLLLRRWRVQLILRQFDQLPSIDSCHLHIMLLEEDLELHDDVGYVAPLIDEGPAERGKLGCLLEQLAFSEYELVERILIHQLVVAPGVDLLLSTLLQGYLKLLFALLISH